MMRAIRWVLGKVLLTWDGLTHPKAEIVRNNEDQKKVDAMTKNLILYHMEACPFCIKVRREISRLGLTIEMRDILKNPKDGEELVAQGGQDQVPCLKISQPGQPVQWLYESDDINAWLRKEFGL